MTMTMTMNTDQPTWQAIASACWYSIDIVDDVATYESDSPDFTGVLTITYSSDDAAVSEAWGPGEIELAEYNGDEGDWEYRWPLGPNVDYWPYNN